MTSNDNLHPSTAHASLNYIVVPGQVIASAPLDSSEFLRGHGTYVERTNSQEHLVASVVGRVQRVNKLIHVESVASSIYQGQVGDLVVGRIIAVAATRWKVQLTMNSREASLPLSGVHLPGGVQRVRTAQDARDMRHFLQEGDLVSAEVHKVQNDGSLMLHTRSHRYGKLENGCLVTVPPALVPRRKNHYATLLGFDVLWGCNGMIWVQRKLPDDTNHASDLGSASLSSGQQELAEQQEQRRQDHADMPYSPQERQDLARLRNVIECLRLTYSLITDEAVAAAYNKSIELNLSPAQVLLPSNVIAVTEAVREI